MPKTCPTRVSFFLSTTRPSIMLCQTLTGWSFREASPPSAQTSGNSWIRCKHDKPCTQLHLDLQDAGLIPDPFLLRNADLDSVQEPGRNPNGYEYKLDFLPQSELVASERRHDLVFEGCARVARGNRDNATRRSG